MVNFAEAIGIGKPPKRPSNVDQQLVRFIADNKEKHPSGFCGRCLLGREDGYGNSASVIRKKGWVTRSMFGVQFGRSKPIYHYFLTESGKQEALAAQERVAEYKRKLEAWSAEFKEKRQRYMNTVKLKQELKEQTDEQIST